MKKNNSRLLALLLVAGISSQVFGSDALAAEDKHVDNKVATEVEASEVTTYSNFTNEVYEDGKDYPKNEAAGRESDGTDKYNRATEVQRESYGEDKNVVDIDPEVKAKLEETNGEYGKKNGKYSNNKLQEVLDPIKDIVINPGSDQSEVAITWFANQDAVSAAVVDGKSYKASGNLTDDDGGYWTYTALITGLEAGSHSYYVHTGDEVSQTYSFDVKPLGEDNEFTVAYFGDPQIGSGDSVWDKQGLNKNTQAKVDQDKVDFKKVLDRAEKADPHFYLSMGDNVEIATYEGEYDAFLNDEFYRNHIFVSIEGNHETYIGEDETNPNNKVFKDHFYLPNESADGRIVRGNNLGGVDEFPGDYWYSFGDTLFLNINSNEEDNSKHESFVENAIKEAVEKRGSNYSFIVASFHHSPYSTATHSADDDIIQRRKDLVRVFNNNNVDIVLNGHDHIYTRSKQLLAGEDVMAFEDAIGTSLDNPSIDLDENNFSKTHGIKINDNGEIITDGIALDYNKREVTDPKGTVFLTMSTSAGSKYYNPIGEDNWYVARSLDDRSQLFSILTFSKHRFNIRTMDVDGNVVDDYTINKTDENIANGRRIDPAKDKKALVDAIDLMKLKANDAVAADKLAEYKQALETAQAVLADENASQAETDGAVRVLRFRAKEIGLDLYKVVENTNKNTVVAEKSVATKEVKEEKTEDKKEAKEVKDQPSKSSNPKTGVAGLTGVVATLGAALAGLFASKRK